MEMLARTTPTPGIATRGSKSDKPIQIYTARGTVYCVRQIDWKDTVRHADYQRLRAEVFVGQRHWDLPLEADGRECDRYDVGGGRNIHVYTVYTRSLDGFEQLLGGVRVFTLRHWGESMIAHEFLRAGMVPPQVVEEIRCEYDAENLVELTRLCVIPGRHRGAPVPHADLAVARDLVYSSAYAAAAAVGRTYAIGLTDEVYARVMRRSHFVFETLYSQRQHGLGDCSLVLIDLVQTIHAIRAAGEHERAARMLLGCPQGWA
jgi:N-acyl-L-homoserine lactone synthetase